MRESEFYEAYWRAGTADPERAQLVQERQARLRVTLARLPRGAKILDAGCGSGVFTNFFTTCGYDALGIDVSANGIQHARVQYPQLRFEVASLQERLPFDDGAFQAVWCTEVIEHLFDVPYALREIARVLAPNGMLALTTPYHGLVKNVFIALTKFDRHFDPSGEHIRFFTARSLEALLAAQGFTVETMSGIGRVYPFWMSHYVVAFKTGRESAA